MKLRSALVLLVLGWLPACSQTPAGGPAQETAAETPAARIEQLHAAVGALQKKPEHQAAEVQVQHILVAVAGGGVEGATRSPAEAEELTAELYARAASGEEFDTLERNHSGDTHPGIYTMSAQPTEVASVIARQDMAAGLGDVAWKLAVGEIGVAPYDGPGQEKKSPFGYHIVKRLK